jgi:protein phosphatase
MNNGGSFNPTSETLPKHFLWAVGLDAEAFPTDTYLPGDRYRAISPQVLLDTQPFRMPEITEEVPSYVISYLKLSRLPLHLPRPYGMLRWGEGLDITEVLLLQNVPLDESGQLLPTLEESWANASALRQINWLSQVLQLWQPLQEEHMTLTLLQQRFLRVDGPWLRIVELQADVTQTDLVQLGDEWVQWIAGVQPEIEEPLAEFFYSLSRGDLDITKAIAKLDQIALERFQTTPLTIRIASDTDKGPRRDHNEDTCYPDPKRPKRSQQPEYLRDRLAIICDGLGGHEGGEVASSMAIKTFEQQLQVLLRQVETDEDPFSPLTFTAQLEAITRIVNDLIVARNDQQQRQAQQRMGTTLVLAIAPRPHGKPSKEIYIVNVGDSRAYWITPQNCCQITLDDDVATRETTLGYNFYAYSAQRLDGGALIQALGTRPSNALLPRVQRFNIDEDCLLLLCSDGLSDYDRVEELWKNHLRPVLLDDTPLDQACHNLVDQANTLNGHDNVTVALMRCRLSPPDPNEASVEADVTEASASTSQEKSQGESQDDALTELRSSDEEDLDNIAAAIFQKGELAIATPSTAEEKPTQKSTQTTVAKVPTKKAAKSEVPPTEPTGNSLLLALILIMFLLGSAIAITQVPGVHSWLERNIPGFPDKDK